VDRVFLDANVLFSAAYRSDSGLLALWRRAGASLLTSAYAVLSAGQAPEPSVPIQPLAVTSNSWASGPRYLIS
jgi:hypothetical protein